jgi:hypothetical protein
MNCNLKHQPQTIFCVGFKITLKNGRYLQSNICNKLINHVENFQHDLDQYKGFFTEKKEDPNSAEKLPDFYDKFQ